MLLDLVFPKICVGCGQVGSYFCKKCVGSFPIASQVCPMCNKGSVGGVTHAGCSRSLSMDGLVCVFPYRGAVQDFVKRLKYRFARDMGVSAIKAISSAVDLSMTGYFRKENFALVSVPLHPVRERWRGFNQANLLAELLAKRWDLELVKFLERVKNTKSLAESQVSFSKEEKAKLEEKYRSVMQRKLVEKQLLVKKKMRLRVAQMKGAFKVQSKLNNTNSRFKLQGSQILIIDDVWTSGATMRECAKVLKRKGALKVWGLVFARSGR